MDILALEPWVFQPPYPDGNLAPESVRRAYEKWERGREPYYTVTRVRLPHVHDERPQTPIELLELWWRYEDIHRTWTSVQLKRALPKSKDHYELFEKKISYYKANVLIVPDNLESDDPVQQLSNSFAAQCADGFEPYLESDKCYDYRKWLLDIKHVGGVQRMPLPRKKLWPVVFDGSDIGVEQSYARILLWIKRNFSLLGAETLQKWSVDWEAHKASLATAERQRPRDKIKYQRQTSRQKDR